jgi:peptidoglycan/LPS O-acetylase OafA/YrhL/lysophospholipase L1-like esterase
MPGIDALRAIAVLAVFLYHAGVGWMPGGFLGVDVFFVISGYLITSLLLSEYRRGGHIRLGRFWARRARRLLPAVGVLIAVTMVVAAIVEPDRVNELRGDAIASLAYVANWHFIFAHQSYFDQFQRPSLFRHLWSLSVEEQFYLFWPLIFAAGMTLLGRRRLILGVLAGALGSVALAWALFDPHDASRAYYGTDTHAVGLLIGVALALAWSPGDLRRDRPSPWFGPLLDLLGAVGLGYIVLSFVQVHDYDLALFHGGYLWLALFTALLIAALAHPAARLGRLLAQPPVVWLGLRSYSFYLWHWPVLALTRPGIDVSMPRGFLIPLQLVAVLALAELSYRFVEVPFRRRPDLADPSTEWLRYGRPALLAAVLAAVFAIGWSGISGSGGNELASGATAASTAEFAQVKVSPAARSASGASGDPRGRTAPANPARPPRIVALGDSVMIGAKERLAARLGRRFSMNARVSRQADEFVNLVERLKAHGGNLDALIIQMGNNGPLYGDEMEAIRRATANVGQLFLINDLAPVSWSDESDEKLSEAARDWPHTELIDWRSAVDGHEGRLTWDGLHLTPAGAGAYARLVTRVVRSKVAWPAHTARPAHPGERQHTAKKHAKEKRSKRVHTHPKGVEARPRHGDLAARGADRHERERVRRHRRRRQHRRLYRGDVPGPRLRRPGRTG